VQTFADRRLNSQKSVARQGRDSDPMDEPFKMCRGQLKTVMNHGTAEIEDGNGLKRRAELKFEFMAFQVYDRILLEVSSIHSYDFSNISSKLKITKLR
jgi:hypothetical protein